MKILARLSADSYQPLPYFLEHVPAGFPSPADGYQDATIDLNELCITHPSATFLVRASGLSMVGVGIYPDDLLIVDRSIEATTDRQSWRMSREFLSPCYTTRVGDVPLIN